MYRYKHKIKSVTCPIHGRQEDYLVGNHHEGGLTNVRNIVCSVKNCSHSCGGLVVEYQPDLHPVIESLIVLLRCFVHGVIEGAGYTQIDIMSVRKKVRISYHENSNCIKVGKLNAFGLPDSDRASTFDLIEPRALIGVVRGTCMRLGQDLPSVACIDEVLEKGPPAWMLDE